MTNNPIAKTRYEVGVILVNEGTKFNIDELYDSIFVVSIGEATCHHHFMNIDHPNGSWSYGADNVELPIWINSDELIFNQINLE